MIGVFLLFFISSFQIFGVWKVLVTVSYPWGQPHPTGFCCIGWTWKNNFRGWRNYYFMYMVCNDKYISTFLVSCFSWQKYWWGWGFYQCWSGIVFSIYTTYVSETRISHFLRRAGYGYLTGFFFKKKSVLDTIQVYIYYARTFIPR